MNDPDPIPPGFDLSEWQSKRTTATAGHHADCDCQGHAIEAIGAVVRWCHHCGALPDKDGDHSCPCPYSDEECPDHAT